MRKIDDAELLQGLKNGTFKSQKEAAEYFNVSEAAISKRLKRLRPLPASFQRLTEKQRAFAIEVGKGQTKTNAAMAAYDVTSRESAKVLGINLMKKNDIKEAVAEVMQDAGLTKRHRVERLKQHIDSMDPHVSLKGLDQSWKLDGAYVDRVEVDHRSVDIVAVTADLETIYENLKQLRSAKVRLLREKKQSE